MIYYVRSDNLWILEEQEHKLLYSVVSNLAGRGSMTFAPWSSHWLLEADEGLDLYMKIRWGLGMPIIPNEEYKILHRDGIIFFSKARTLELRTAISAISEQCVR